MNYTARGQRITYSFKLPTRRGFTLIELLVVMAIIFTVTGIIFVNLMDVRARSRDAKRKGDLAVIQSALQQARSDAGRYPIDLNDGNAPDDLYTCDNPFSWNSIQYLKKTPCGSGTDLDQYEYTSSGTTYTLYACLENENDPQRDAVDQDTTAPGIDTCGLVGEVSYTVRNP